MISKPQSKQKYLTVIIVFTSMCLVTIGFGLYGSINLVREVTVALPATAKYQEFATATTIAKARTATAEVVTASTETARAQWSRLFFDPFDVYYTGHWPRSEVHSSFTEVSTYIESGNYFIEISAGLPVNWQVWSIVRVGSEFELKVDVKNTSGLSNAAYGVAFREEDGDFYVFLISDNSLYRIGLMKDGDWDSVLQLSRTAAIKPGEINTLKVEAYGSHLFFYINDQLVGEVNDDTLMSGRAGLCVYLPTGQEGVFIFDNFTLSGPPY